VGVHVLSIGCGLDVEATGGGVLDRDRRLAGGLHAADAVQGIGLEHRRALGIGATHARAIVVVDVVRDLAVAVAILREPTLAIPGARGDVLGAAGLVLTDARRLAIGRIDPGLAHDVGRRGDAAVLALLEAVQRVVLARYRLAVSVGARKRGSTRIDTRLHRIAEEAKQCDHDGETAKVRG
jgi:hypothetical protein